MAGFRTHFTTSTVLGIGYGAAAHELYGVPLSTSMLGGGLCAVAGMLPDLDSDSGVPLRESLAFSAAIIPMLLLPRLAGMGLDHDAIAGATMVLYLLIRFPLADVIKSFTAHRGMFHSLPACLIFGELTFLLCSGNDVHTRLFKAGGIVIGFMSHLILDEIWSIRFRAGIPVGLKSSSGTAIKFWGDKTMPNLFTWGCVGVLTWLSIDGRVYQGDVAPFVRIIETGGSSIVGTSEPKDEWRPSYGRTDVDAAQRENPAWNR